MGGVHCKFPDAVGYPDALSFLESEAPKSSMNMDFLTVQPVFNTLCCVLSHLRMRAKLLQSRLTL